MNASKPTKAAYFEHIGSIELPTDIWAACHRSVTDVLDMPEVKAEMAGIDPEGLRRELSTFSNWTDNDLADHQTNIRRILCITAEKIFFNLI